MSVKELEQKAIERLKCFESLLGTTKEKDRSKARKRKKAKR